MISYRLHALVITRIFIGMCAVFLFSCNDERKDATPVSPVIIDLQPFDDIPKEQVAFVYQELVKIYPNIKLLAPITLPRIAFYSKGNRYRADTLIRYLRQRTPSGHVTLGLTSKDISTTKGNMNDYGIMGLGYQPGRACVVSPYRLSRKNRLLQFFKLSIHELGHTQGLPHCPEPTCFMRDAKGKNHADEETDFCPTCKAHLISKGWKLPA